MQEALVRVGANIHAAPQELDFACCNSGCSRESVVE
jgi:hypothetical protein